MFVYFFFLCEIGCPGTEVEFECDGVSLFNEVGTCVKNVLRPFDENLLADWQKIKRCDSGSQAQDTKCQCAQEVGKEPQLGKY